MDTLGIGIMNTQLYCRLLSSSDITLIKSASVWQTMKYGFAVDPEVSNKKINDCLNKEDQETYVAGCFDKDELIGINTHVAWQSMPFWSFAGLIIKPDNVVQGIMSNRQTAILAKLLEFNCALGEQNERFDWITVTQDSTHQSRTRHYRIMEEIYTRYTGVDLSIIIPGEPHKYKYLEYVLSFAHKKPLVVKMFSLKNELRSANWKNYKSK